MSDAGLWVIAVAALGFAALTAFMAIARRPTAAAASALFCVATLFLILGLRDPGVAKWIGLAVASMAGSYATWRALETGH